MWNQEDVSQEVVSREVISLEVVSREVVSWEVVSPKVVSPEPECPIYDFLTIRFSQNDNTTPPPYLAIVSGSSIDQR